MPAKPPPPCLDFRGDAIVSIVRDGDIPSLLHYISTFKEVDITSRDSRGKSILYIACERGYSKILSRVLLATNLNESEVGILLNSEGLLVVAADNGHAECCQILLSHKQIDPNQTVGANGTTALHRAVTRGHANVCRVLLEYNGENEVSLDKATTDLGNTVLHVAVETNRIEILRLLIAQQNAPLNVANYSGATPLITAVSYARVDMVNALLAVGDIDVNARAEGDLGTAIYCACSHSIGATAALQIVDALLCHSGINVNIEERLNGNTPLIACCRRGNEALANMLLEHNETLQVTEFIDDDPDDANQQIHSNLPDISMSCNINKVTYDGESALMSASKRGYANIVRSLLCKEELDMNAQNVFGITALSMASRKGHTEVVKMLAAKESTFASLQRARNSAKNDEIREILQNAEHTSIATDQVGCEAAWFSHVKLLEVFLSPQKKK